MRFKKIFLNVVVLFCSLAATTLILEIGFRIFYPQSQYAITNAPWGFRHIPNRKIIYYFDRSGSYRLPKPERHAVPIAYNSKGLRDYEYAYQKPANSFRILVIGDSWTEDMGSYFENLHVKYLERKLNSKNLGTKFEVINAGHYAYENDQELMYYLKEGRKYNPDIVMVIYAVDQASPKYSTLENGELVLHYQSFSRLQKLRRAVVSFVRSRSHFGNFFLNSIASNRFLDRLFIMLGLKEENRYAVLPHFKNSPFGNTLSSNLDFGQVDKKIFSAFKEHVENEGGQFIFVSFDCLTEEKIDFLNKNEFYYFAINLDFKKISQDRISDIERKRYNKYLDSHRFGYKANELVADQILGFLVKNGFIPHSEEYQMEPVN